MQQKTNSTLIQAMNSLKKNIMSNINCHNVGKVVEFNPANMSASVEYLQLDMYNNIPAYPIIIEDVPILFIGNKNARITFNPVGTNCLLCFLDRNIDTFLETGESYIPATTRKHSISDCIAICTFNTDVDAQPYYNENDLSISNKSGNINLYSGTTGKIKIFNDNQNLKTILTNLTTAIENITIEGKPIDNNEELEAVKTAIGELLD